MPVHYLDGGDKYVMKRCKRGRLCVVDDEWWQCFRYDSSR